MIVGLLAVAVVAPPQAGSVAQQVRKCKKSHAAKRRCRARARIAITPPVHDFGTIGQADGAPTDLVVSNIGRRASGIPTASISGSGERYFQINATTCSSRLTPGASCTLTVQSVHNDGASGVAQLDVSAAPGGTASASLLVNLF
jgi:hypothetical protein